MKNLILFLGFLFLTIGCEKEIKEISVNANDGKDGKNGYSASMYFDPIAMMKISYWDRNNNSFFDSGDTIIYRESHTGLKIDRNPSEEGCYDIIQIVEKTEIIVGTICNGTNAHNDIFGSRDMFNSTGDTIIGQYLDIYWDMENTGEIGYGILSINDILKKVVPIMYGKNGVKGDKGDKGDVGETPIPNMEYTNDSIIYTFTIDGVLLKGSRYSIPRSKDGITPALQATATFEGVIYLWYLDLNSNKSFDNDSIDSKLAENLITNGTNGTDGKSFYNFSNEEDCNVASSYYYDSIKKWSLIGTPESMNHEGAPAIWINGFSEPFYNGTMIDYDYLSAPAIVWCPPFNAPAGFNYLTLGIGSRDSSFVELFVKYADGRTELVKSEWVIPVPNFVWYLTETYAQKFTYEVSVNNLDFTAVRWGLRITEKNPLSVPKIDWKNHVFHGDNFKWRYVLPIR